MSKAPASPDQHRSFTVRVPLALYLQMGKLAQDEGGNMNKKVNQLLLLGLGKHISLDSALRRLIVEKITDTEETA